MLIKLFSLFLVSFISTNQALAKVSLQTCAIKKLRFSADEFRAVPAAGSKIIWGGNATQGNHVIAPPFDSEFLQRLKLANQRGVETFGYLEGPCGDTGGVDDGERDRCAKLHRDYNRRYSPNTPNTAIARWKPYTFAQMTVAKTVGLDHCEIDNLNNNVNVPLIPLLKEIKNKFNKGEIGCRLVLKNVDISEMRLIKSQVAPTVKEADFLSPFHIFEDDTTRRKAALESAFKAIKGPRAVVIISTDTNAYGSSFTPDSIETCSP